MNKNIILTDCDGVLLDWETTFVEWMGTKGFTPDPGEFGYEMAKRFGMKKQKVKDLIREFNESAWIGYLKPYKDSGLYWIEDKPENAKLGADMGLNTIMLRHQHNANFTYDGVKVVDNWTQIVNYIN